jgi:hypothetical protein
MIIRRGEKKRSITCNGPHGKRILGTLTKNQPRER